MSISENSDVAERVADGRGASEGKRPFRRLAFASLIGSVIEGYDFGLYGVAAALVFPKVFFPSLGSAAGTVASLGTLGVAFVARPLGAILFGHLGDRIGRRATLIATVLGIGLGTALMGLIPPAASIGVAAPILIIILRAVQGLALGGEWQGAALLVTEQAPRGRRGLYAMFPQLGASIPIALSALTLLIVSSLVDPATFIAWGWRVPFLASAPLVIVALYIRLKVEETDAFVADRNRGKTASIPLFQALKHQPWTMVRCAGVALTTLTLVYVAQSFVANYGVTHVGLSRNEVLIATMVSGLFYAGFTCISSLLSDRMSRRTLIGGSHLLAVVWALVLFPLVNTGSFAAYIAGLCGSMAIAGLAYGGVAVFLPEQFPTRYRYTASGVAYQITGLLGGGIAPVLAPVVLSSFGSGALGYMLAGISVVAAACTFSLKDKGKESMDWAQEGSRA